MRSSVTDIKEFVMSLLSGLPAELHYHNKRHTQDVLTQCEEIGMLEGVPGYEIYLLQVAALFHDTGFINNYDGHELESCRIAENYLPNFGFTGPEIELVHSIILCTRMPQQPHSHLGKIICDSDLDYLGREDFMEISEDLLKELTATGRINSRKEWNDLQVEFLEKHSYFTHSNRMRREIVKKQNLLLVTGALNV